MEHLESDLQINCIRWFRLQHPRFDKLLFAVPNGGKRNAREALRLKYEGAVPGVSDLLFLFPNKLYNFLCIEMKINTTKQSDNQKIFEKEVKKVGGNYVICKTFFDFQKAINDHLKLSILT